MRFISITNGYDSNSPDVTDESLIIPLKNIINEGYAKDISQKITTSFEARKKQGQFMGKYPVYGYLKDPENKNHLIVNPETCGIVKRIFQMRDSGMALGAIASQLNEEGIPSPAQYALNHKRGMDWRRVNQKTAWDPTKIVAILKDERYAGNMVSLRRTLNGIYGADTPIEKNEWVRVENTHEAIIPYEDFVRVQDTFLIYRKGRPEVIQKYNAFTCAYCGRKLSYSRDRKN